MFGIQGRLTALFVVIVTVVLGISGTYAQYSLGHELEVANQRLREGVLTRLQTSLPSALWDLDKAKVFFEEKGLPAEWIDVRNQGRTLLVSDPTGARIELNVDPSQGHALRPELLMSLQGHWADLVAKR